MGSSKKFDSREQYWEDYHKEQLPPADEKEAVRYQYDNNVAYWLNHYEDKIGFALDTSHPLFNHFNKFIML